MLESVIAITGVASLIAFLTAIAHKSLTQIAWHDLEDYCRRREKEVVFDNIHDRHDSAVASTEVLQDVAVVTALFTVFRHSFVASLPTNSWPWPAFILLTVVCVLAGVVWIPREVSRCWGTAYLTNTWPVWSLVDRAFWPLHAVAAIVRLIIQRLAGRVDESSEEEALEDEILSIVTEGQHDGLLEDDVREMIAGVIELDDTDVADIMTPRSKMDVLSLDTPWDDILRFVVRVGRTRIPVYAKHLDNIVGLLYVKDLLAFLLDDHNQRPCDLRDILREVRRVPERKRLDELLQTFLHTQSHLAIVVDEFMHVVGLVTIEDVLEEIVGEIVDESDAEEPADIRWIGEHAAEVQARAHVEDVNEAMGVQLPISNEYDTVGGFILNEFGRIPHKGEILHFESIQITIEQATKRRIERVRLDVNQNPKTIGAT